MAGVVSTLCDFADQNAASNCGEALSGIATTAYIGFKNDLKEPYPQAESAGDRRR